MQPGILPGRTRIAAASQLRSGPARVSALSCPVSFMLGLQPRYIALARAGAGRAARHPSGPDPYSSSFAAALRARTCAFDHARRARICCAALSIGFVDAVGLVTAAAADRRFRRLSADLLPRAGAPGPPPAGLWPFSRRLSRSSSAPKRTKPFFLAEGVEERSFFFWSPRAAQPSAGRPGLRSLPSAARYVP